MADLRDVPIVFRQVGTVNFLKKVWHEVGDDNLFTWAAALAYSWLFAIFPFFLTLLAILPLLKHDWRKQANDQIDEAIKQLPHDAGETVKQYVEPKLTELLKDGNPASITSLLSITLLVTLWASSGGMAMTMAAMDRCYDVERIRPFYKQRPIAIVLTITVAVLILFVVILVPVGTVVTRYLTSGTEAILTATKLSTQPITVTDASGHAHHTFRLWIAAWQIVRHSLAFIFLLWVLALVYHFGPNVKQKFRVITPGAIFTLGVWILLAIVLRFYIDRFGKYNQTYGALGGVIILLFFFYLDALVMLVGAEINAEIDAAKRVAAHEQAKPPPEEETIDTRLSRETP